MHALHSVRFRLTLWYAGLLALALALFAVSVYVFVVRTLQSNVDEALQSYGQQLRQAAAPHVHGKNLDVHHVTVPAEVQREAVGILIMNYQGQATTVQRGKSAANYSELRVAIHSGKPFCSTIPATGGSALRHAPQRMCITLQMHHGKPVGGVEVVASLAGVDRTLDRLRLALLLGIPFVLVFTGWGGWILAGRALQPVDSITRMARSISATDLSQRINLHRQDELGRLAATFDEMIDRLEQAFREQRQLTADVSHELRSPLAILEAQTTLALRRSRSEPEYRQILGSVQEEVEHMTSVLGQLLTLARAEAGEEPLSLQPIDLARTVEPVVDTVQALAETKGVRLRMEAQAGVWVLGDGPHLRQLLVNLLTNALQFTPEGGFVLVSVHREGASATIEVADTGCGIDREDIPHIFKRFYRADRARSRTTGNSGLGLAIVRWIVDAHGGEVTVVSQPGEGARFLVSLPPTCAPVGV